MNSLDTSFMSMTNCSTRDVKKLNDMARDDRDAETERRRHERFGDLRADLVDRHAAALEELERTEDADDRAEEADERRRRGDRAEVRQAAAQVRRLALLDALERAVDGVDEVEVTDVVGAFGLERLAALEQRGEARLHDLRDRALVRAARRVERLVDLVLAQVLAERLHVANALVARRAERQQALGDHVEHEHRHAGPSTP